MNAFRRHTGSFALILPLTLFLGVFFIWPLLTVLQQAVSDPVVSKNLPRTTAAISAWNPVSEPSDEMRTALVDDLKSLDDDQNLGEVVRRLNSAQPGFRTLMRKTVAAVRDGTEPISLPELDARWNDTAFWRAVAEATEPYTDRNLLAAVDLQHDASGAIVAMPAGESANQAILLRTFAVAAVVTLATCLIGLPYAMLAAAASGWRRQLLLAAVLLPLWTSLLVRTAAWYVLLQDKGLINSLLVSLGLLNAPLPLLFNRTGVVIAMTHVLLPFMVLPIYSVLIAIPRNLMPAAASLGARPIRAFLHILLPLALRGIASGGLLVFMAALGYYITPALIGGPKDQMISSVIAFYATGSANWGMAGALGMVLLAVTIVLYGVYGRLSMKTTGA
ncbi:ABC transporter permease protein [Rhizobium phaseoli]|uniref:ABC transporter permease n=1 Tax=Rhizobium phaseoli TaxID=396 RepID=A0A192T4F1_9HYPH|nr:MULTISPECIES: ABC transporter permease [Rhizobium]MDH6647173.1 putative spermidine/putrescine transport system permease protein [Rhizobium esperanzae]ANL26080.1 ABC transporter permease protein [Rhizobium phaseoli]ANL38647.1 ABC transporter permease protein [Rhizobium phaseoli]ANL51396.1 ABC transporter permease protein [Rhizobium phaseoli]ANL57636.1 ABC transporter permease protein [Rhizobium phaseoli]